MTGRWRQPKGDAESAPLRNGIRDNQINHPALTRRVPPNDEPPSMRIGMRIACSPIESERPATPELRRALKRFLARPAVTDLIADFVHVDNLAWGSWGTSARNNLAAVLTDGNEDVAPPAWARLLLPDPTLPLPWRDPLCADFLVHIEPRARNGEPTALADLIAWHRRFASAFVLFDAVTRYMLEGDLRLTTDKEPSGKLAVWLETPRDLTQLVDVERHDRVAGTQVSRWFHGYAVADDTGARSTVVAAQWIRQLCDDALHLDDYEQVILALDA